MNSYSRRNGQELASIYDQNHNDNHANSMSSQVLVSSLGVGDQVTVYLYTNTGTTDRKSNHFTQFSGMYQSLSIAGLNGPVHQGRFL